MVEPRLIAWHGPVVDPGSSCTDDPSVREEVWVYRAEFNIPVTPLFVYSQRECPKYFDPFKYNGVVDKRIFVVGRECKQMPDAPQVMEVRIKYSNVWTNQQNGDKPNVQFQWIVNPLERPALIEWGSYTVREAVEIDEDGKAVTTTTGEPIAMDEERHRRRLTITKNVSEVTDIFAEGEDYMNEEDTRIGGHLFKKHTLWLWPIDIGHISMENGVLYFPITMNILHNPKTWYREIRNAGYYMRAVNSKVKIDPNSGLATIYYPMEPIVFKDKGKADRPVLLDRITSRPLQLVYTGKKKNHFGRFEKTYDLLAPEDFGRAFTQDELERTKLKFRTRKLLNFTKNLPPMS